MRIISILFLVAFLVGCSEAPEETDLTLAIRTAMMSEGVPPSFVGNMLGGVVLEIDEINIEDVSRETEEPIPLMKMMGAKERDYWKVTITTRGIAQIDSNKMLANMLSSDPKSIKDFNVRVAVKVYENEDGSLDADIPLSF